MKTLIAALTLATLIAAPASVQSALASANDGYFGQWKQGCNITYRGTRCATGTGLTCPDSSDTAGFLRGPAQVP